MRKWFSLLVLFALSGFGQEAVVTAKVLLSDGSQLVGAPQVPSLALDTILGRQVIPLEQVAALDFTPDGVRVTFANKDVLSGKPEGTAFALKTIFKDVRLAYPHIKAIHLSCRRGAAGQGMREPGLLLHAALNADNEDLSVFGASMEAKNVQIISSPQGGSAMLLGDATARVVILLPFSPYVMPEGTVEFWAMVPDPHRRFGNGGGQPWFFNFESPIDDSLTSHWIFGFCVNDGCGFGGLVGRKHGLTCTGTHSYGRVKNIAETGLLGDSPDGWHHYALIWKQDGVDFPGAKGAILVLTVDGKIVAASRQHMPAPAGQALDDPDMKVCLVIHDRNSDLSVPLAMADLKIWEHAKLPDVQRAE